MVMMVDTKGGNENIYSHGKCKNKYK